jgi:hypothetical protein
MDFLAGTQQKLSYLSISQVNVIDSKVIEDISELSK